MQPVLLLLLSFAALVLTRVWYEYDDFRGAEEYLYIGDNQHRHRPNQMSLV